MSVAAATAAATALVHAHYRGSGQAEMTGLSIQPARSETGPSIQPARSETGPTPDRGSLSTAAGEPGTIKIIKREGGRQVEQMRPRPRPIPDTVGVVSLLSQPGWPADENLYPEEDPS